MEKLRSQLFFYSILASVLFLGLFFVSYTEANAQVMTFEAGNIKVTPEFPKANESVTVKLEDFSTNLGTKTISWVVNGSQKQSGVGLTSYTFTTGALGSVYNISISAGGVSYSKTIRVTEVDVIWQATDSFVSPFYKGKALFPNQGKITVTAIPHFMSSDGSRLDPKKLVYKWKKAGGAVQDQSGYGKDTIHLKGVLIGRPTVYEVEVSSSDGSYKGKGSVTVEETRPEILLYKDDPLYGIDFNHLLNDKEMLLNQEEVEIRAMPFFFSGEIPQFTWRVGGNNTANSTGSVTLRKDGFTGISPLFVKATHMTNFVQTSDANMKIQTVTN